MMNTGNGADGLVVSVDCNIFTDFGVVAATGTPSGEHRGRDPLVPDSRCP